MAVECGERQVSFGVSEAEVGVVSENLEWLSPSNKELERTRDELASHARLESS